MSEDKVNDDLYRRVEEHLQELIEPDLPEAKLSPAERLELIELARASEPCRELLESYEKTVSLLSSRPDAPVPADFSRQVGESIDDSTPVIPFVRTEKFQRLLGAAAGGGAWGGGSPKPWSSAWSSAGCRYALLLTEEITQVLTTPRRRAAAI